MGFVVLGIAFVVIVTFGAVVQWLGRREFRDADPHGAPPDGPVLPSEASLTSGEYGVGSTAPVFKDLPG